MHESRISLIAAIGKNRELGKGNDLLWHISDDLKRFKEITSGHPVIMGRKTWESLPEKFRPLPDRLNIVVTRQLDYAALGAKICGSIEEAIEKAHGAVGGEEIFIIGGGELYTAALPHAHRLYLTIIEDSKDADVFFPEYENQFTKVIECSPQISNDLHYTWLTLDRT
jgi:dihydrofolate reductase